MKVAMKVTILKAQKKRKIRNDCKYPENTGNSSLLAKEKPYLKRMNGIFFQ